jgi:hypothetical protein
VDFHLTAAAVALLHDLMANPAVIRTALCGHERALSAFSNGCTNHWNHPLTIMVFIPTIKWTGDYPLPDLQSVYF